MRALAPALLSRWRSSHHAQPHHAPAAAPCCAHPQTLQTGGGSEFVPGELDVVGEIEEGGEFDPDDLLEEGDRPVVEESAGAAAGWGACMGSV